MKSSTSVPTDSKSPTNLPSFMLSGDINKDMSTLEERKVIKNQFALGRWLKNEYGKCKSQMDPIKRQWYLNLSFYKGDQYVDFIGGRIINIPMPSSRAKLVINRIKPVVRTEVSRLTSQEPTVEVVPASNEEKDVMAAAAAEAVVNSCRERLGLQRILRQAAWWCSVTGVGYIKTYWDKSKEYEDPNEQLVVGDHCYSAVSPFHIMVPDLLLEDIEEQPYVLNVFTKPVDWVKMHYPEVTEREGWTPSVVSVNEIMETAYLNTKGNDGHNAKPDSCLIIEAWVKPDTTALLPKGGRLLMVDDLVVSADQEGIPYEHGQYPFAKMDSIQSGSYYGTSVIEDLIPLQREINRTRSQLIEARNLTSKPGFFYRTGSMDVGKWTSAPGQAIDIKPGSEFPQPIPLPQMPAYVENMQDRFLTDVEDISGQHQVSKGNAPAGVTAGTAIQFLQEADNSFMATTHASIEDCLKKIAHQTIALAIQYWDSERLVKYVGRDGQMNARYLSQVHIKSGTDIRIESGSSLPVSKAARIALFMDLMTRGAIPVDQALKLMSLPSMKAYYDLIEVDEKQATRENVYMTELDPEQTLAAREEVVSQVMAAVPQGIDPAENPLASQQMELANQPVIEVHEWDNHDKHIEVHTRFMKGQEYEMLPDEIKNEFELHLQAHKDMRMKAQMEELFKQMSGGAGEDMQMPEGEPGAPEGNENNAEGGNQFSGMEEPQVDTGAPPQ
jgi:hypothetical protein